MKINLRVIRERISINVRYITLFTFIIVFSLSLGIFLSWILINYGFNAQLSLLAVLLAAAAVGVNIGIAVLTKDALKLTRGSLDLTKSMTRPFISIDQIVYQPPRTIEIVFCNTGVFPPDSNSFQVIFSKNNDFSEPNEINKLSIPVTHESPPIFPGNKLQWDLFLNKDSAENINNGNEVYLKLDINYLYNEKEEGITSRISYLPKSGQGRKRTPLSILTEGGYWK